MTRRAADQRRAPGAWGTAEQLPSGRWRAFYRRDARKFTAPRTFDTKADALAWLATERADRSRGIWHDPQHGRVTLAEYAHTWLESRPDLAPRTVVTYRWILARWILPRVGGPRGLELGPLELSELSPALIRAWYAALFTESRESAERVRSRAKARGTHPARLWARQTGLEVAQYGRLSPDVLSAWEAAGCPDLTPDRTAGTQDRSHAAGRATAAHAYTLLRAVLNTAARDGLITASPCQIAGAGIQKPRERRPATPAEVLELSALMPRRHAAAVTLAAWSSLRYGELFALARRHVDLEAGTLRVERALLHLPGEPITFGPTKTSKSRRLVHLPAFVAGQLAEHMAEHVSADPDALLFTLDDGSPMTTSRLSVLFRKARKVIGREDLTWHDLRHTGATLAYRAGASVPEVQARLGHATMRAALIYAHAADDSDRVLADRLDAMYASPASPAPRLRAV